MTTVWIVQEGDFCTSFGINYSAVNAKEILDKNYEAWKEVYEETYKKKLTYTCDEQADSNE